MEMWDIYDADKKRTGRTMRKNDWRLKDGEYHLTVLGVITGDDQGVGARLVGGFRRRGAGWRGFGGGCGQGDQGRDRT